MISQNDQLHPTSTQEHFRSGALSGIPAGRLAGGDAIPAIAQCGFWSAGPSGRPGSGSIASGGIRTECAVPRLGMVEHDKGNSRGGFIGMGGPSDCDSKRVALWRPVIYLLAAATGVGGSGPHPTHLVDDVATCLGSSKTNHAQVERLPDASSIRAGECVCLHRMGVHSRPVDGSLGSLAVEAGRGILWHSMAELHWLAARLCSNHVWHLAQAPARWIARAGVRAHLVGGIHRSAHFMGFTYPSLGWVLLDGRDVDMGGDHHAVIFTDDGRNQAVTTGVK